MNVTMEKQSLYDLRLAAGIRSQHGLAIASGLSVASIWKAENGQAISYPTAIMIVRALRERGVTVSFDEIDWVITKGK